MLKLTTSPPALLIGIFLFGFLFSQPAAANPSGALTVSPLREELSIAPGTTQKRTMNVTNSSDGPMTVRLSSEVFSVINPDYSYSFTEESAIARWVRFAETEIILNPGETRSVAYDIAVPIGTEPGGAYISIFATNDTQQDETAITLKQRIGLLLYLTVEGEVSRNGALLSLSSPWFVGSAGQWSATLQNTGTAHFRSRYEVTINTLVGTSVSKTDGEALVLPGTVRRISEPFSVPTWPGIYNVTYTIGLGDQPAYSETKTLVVVPLWSWVVLGAMVAAIALFVMMRRQA